MSQIVARSPFPLPQTCQGQPVASRFSPLEWKQRGLGALVGHTRICAYSLRAGSLDEFGELVNGPQLCRVMLRGSLDIWDESCP